MKLELILPQIIKILLLTVVLFVESLFIPGGISITRIGYRILNELNNIDIISYSMNIKIQEDMISFDTDIKLKAIKDKFNEIYFLLNSDYKIISISYGNKELMYEDLKIPSQKVNIWFIKLPYELNKNTEFTINIKYNGKPSGPISYLDKNLCELDIYNIWYPLTGMEDFYSEVTQNIEVNKELIPIGTGRIINVEDKETTKVFTYKSVHPIVIMNLVASKFSKINVESSIKDNIEIYYTQDNKELVNKIKQYISEILKFYSKLGFIPQDNVRIVLTENENKTAYTSLNNILLHYSFLKDATDKQLYHLLSHEIAHLFFGNITSPRIIKGGYLLCEGLAEYFSLLAIKNKYGEEEFKNALLNELKNYQNYIKQHQDKPLYSASYFESYEGSLFYYKGCLVLNMFNYLVGDEVFFEILKLYLKEFKFKFADVNNFCHITKLVYKEDIDWFFDYFVNSTKNIDYGIGKMNINTTKKGYKLNILIKNYGEAEFKKEIEILVKTQREEKLLKRKLNKINKLEIELNNRPYCVIIDPNLTILDINRENNKKLVEFI